MIEKKYHYERKMGIMKKCHVIIGFELSHCSLKRKGKSIGWFV